MFERVSRQVESSPCCDWGTPSSVYALHARNGAMFGPVEIGDSSTHQGALPCGASRFGLVNDGACAFADGWTARSTTSRERRRFRAVPPCRMPRPRPHEQGASAAVSREAGDPRIGDGATALWGSVGRGDAVRQNSRSASPVSPPFDAITFSSASTFAAFSLPVRLLYCLYRCGLVPALRF